MYGFNFDIDTGLNGPAAPRQVMGEGTVICPGPPHRLTQEIPEEWMTRTNPRRRRLCRLREEGAW